MCEKSGEHRGQQHGKINKGPIAQHSFNFWTVNSVQEIVAYELLAYENCFTGTNLGYEKPIAIKWLEE